MSHIPSELETLRRRFIRKIAGAVAVIPIHALAIAPLAGAAGTLLAASAAPASNASAIVDTYLLIHADVRADATIVAFPGRGMTGATAAPASDCTGEETPALRDRGPGLSRVERLSCAPPKASCNSPAI
jgi:hypothetical protein